MTKKNSNSEQPITELIKDKETFKKDLQERIEKGEAILEVSDYAKIKNEFSLWDDYNNEYLKQAFNNSVNEYRSSYDHAGFSSFGSLSRNQYDTLAEKRDTIGYKLENLRKLLSKVDLLKSQHQTINAVENSKLEVSNTEVFIVHGHDETAETKTARFIEKLGFKPIILHEQASGGKTIIEKIEQYSNVGFGIVLYTACDLGGKTATALKSRARQNVVFEHGYLMGKIGRSNVCALVKGDIELPNDMSGVVYVSMDDSNAWHFKVAKEMKNSGYQIDMNKL